MKFRAAYFVRQVLVDVTGIAEPEFRVSISDATILVRLGPASVIEPEWNDPGDASCIATTDIKPPQEAEETFRRIERHDYPELDLGDVSVPLFGALPESFQQFVLHVQRTLSEAVTQIASLVRWRHRRPCPANALLGGSLSWAREREDWHPMPFGGQTYVDELSFKRLQASDLAEVQGLLDGGVAEPLGHELLREAIDQKNSNPRTAVVIAVAAAEVGFKELATDLVPGTQWLLENMQSPPLSKMLRKYLPSLPTRNRVDGQALTLPSPHLRLIDEAIEYRNKVVHLGESERDYAWVLDVLSAVRDFLWLCDFYRGHDWAYTNISEETRAELEGVTRDQGGSPE